MPRLDRLRWLARLLRLYQWSGLPRLVRRLNVLPGPLRVMEGMLPPLSTRYRDHRIPAPAIDGQRGAVAFFFGCIQEAFLSNVNEATIRVLQRNGYEVRFPRAQTCCGAAALHLGEEEQARLQARRNIDAFLDCGADVLAIVNNAGGCGAALKEYPHLLRDDPQYAEKARAFAAKVMDVSEFLAEHLHAAPGGEIQARVVYSDSCHLRHAQKVARQPRDLLRMIPGLELAELEKPDRCCGSAGVYNIQQWETAEAVLDAKMADIDQTGAEIVVVANTGCYMQHVYGAQRSRNHPRVAHLVELLEESYSRGSEPK
jgi:glycolate oxidase iron-sulfur subunit